MPNRRAVGSPAPAPSSPSSGTRRDGEYPGRRLGLPAEGRGSVARIGRRLAGWVVDWLLAMLASTISFHHDQWMTLAVFTLEHVVLVGLTGSSVGQRLVGAQVVRLDGGKPGPWHVLVRAVLLALTVPALLVDRDQRGLHDRAAGTVVRVSRA